MCKVVMTIWICSSRRFFFCFYYLLVMHINQLILNVVCTQNGVDTSYMVSVSTHLIEILILLVSVSASKGETS